jgi:hypothetical protein
MADRASLRMWLAASILLDDFVMSKFDDRTTANLDVVLDSVCRTLPNSGGDHESRRFIAAKMLRAAERGKRTLGALETVARRARKSLSRGRAS